MSQRARPPRSAAVRTVPVGATVVFATKGRKRAPGHFEPSGSVVVVTDEPLRRGAIQWAQRDVRASAAVSLVRLARGETLVR